MNFLAHLWLAQRTGTSLAGAILGDVVRGRDLSAYPGDIALGIRLHRRVDAATDRHPLLEPIKSAFPSGRRRYAGIVLDLAGDHAMTQIWQQLSQESLPDFCTRAGIAVADAGRWFDQAGARRPDAAMFSRLLLSYATAGGIERAVRYTAGRLRQPQAMIDAARPWPSLSLALQPLLPQLLHELAHDADLQLRG